MKTTDASPSYNEINTEGHIAMNLFEPVVAAENWNPNFARVLGAEWAGEREVLQSWADGFPDRDGKFVIEFQTTFNSSFWEVYLYGLFRDYGFEMDWTNASPDFLLDTPNGKVVVEAVTANAAAGAIPEWEKDKLISLEIEQKNFWPLNREAIIRLSNAIVSKHRKYQKSYSRLKHVEGLPFVIAVAPFEQAHFQNQYDRPIRALLFDDYVDETAFYKNPAAFPHGPQNVSLGTVAKDNGAIIDLGMFCSETWAEVSAVMFSCVATWGKASAMSTRLGMGMVEANWSTDNSGWPKKKISLIGQPSETISDGLQIFHNPYALRPLTLETFRREGVVQHYRDHNGDWVRENYDHCLQIRSAILFGR